MGRRLLGPDTKLIVGAGKNCCQNAQKWSCEDYYSLGVEITSCLRMRSNVTFGITFILTSSPIRLLGTMLDNLLSLLPRHGKPSHQGSCWDRVEIDSRERTEKCFF